MNMIRRAIAGRFLSSSSSSSSSSSPTNSSLVALIRQHPQHHQSFDLQKSSRLFSTNPLKKPSEIPWQKKAENSVNLIGRIHQPVQFGAYPDGNYWAGTILSQGGDDGTNLDQTLWIPIIFEGDLAHTAVCHLKVKDYVHVYGSLSADPPPFTVKEGQADFQVMVHDINFVQWSKEAKKAYTSDTPDKLDTSSSDTSSNPWRDLLQIPENWLDHRADKLNGSLNPNYPDFKHKTEGTPLWISKRTPKWALAGLNGSKKLEKKKEDDEGAAAALVAGGGNEEDKQIL